MTRITSEQDLRAALAPAAGYEALVLVGHALGRASLEFLRPTIEAAARLDARALKSIQLVACEQAPNGRLVLAPTGPLERDHDDVRRFADAARDGIVRARDAGARSILLAIEAPPQDGRYLHAARVAALAALGALWEPLEAREARGHEHVEPVHTLGVNAADGSFDDEAARWCTAVDEGLRLACDLCGTEPERMAPPRFAEYVAAALRDTDVQVEIVEDRATIERDYPLLAAVARASQPVERHRPRVVRLELTPPGRITRTLFFAGKGLTYDTGGADLKAGGIMAGMSRDKGGAAAVAGFVLAVARLKVPGVRVVAELGVARNSIGSDAFVTDEILTSHAGVRVRVGNTDAEGRLVLADLLSHLRVRARDAVNPRILSVATLTGHASRAVGPYTIALDNGPARAAHVAESLCEQGDAWGDPCELSRLRREDFDFVRPRSKADDVLSCNNLPSSATPRGHQFPMAFMAIASGLDKHGSSSELPLCFTHVDIGGSGVDGNDWQHGRPNGKPLVAMLRALT